MRFGTWYRLYFLMVSQTINRHNCYVVGDTLFLSLVMKQFENFILRVLGQSPGATAVYDTAMIRIAFANRAMLEIWGRGEEIIGQDLEVIFPEFKTQGFTEILKNVWATGKTYEGKTCPVNITIKGVTELKFFDFTYQAIVEDGNTIAIVHTAADVSGRLRALKKVEEQDAILSFNNELELLTRTLSHDLKNPLSIARMGAQYLQTKRTVDESEQYKWANIILEALNSIEHIINHKIQLNQTRMLVYDKTWVSLDKIIPQVCSESQVLYNNKHGVFEIGHLEALYGNEDVFYQIFFNIIGNAVKYSSKEKSPLIAINSSKKQGFIVYTIRDNGIGIPESEQVSVFQEFHRAKNTGGFPGTGVGLCVVQKIMIRLSGQITLSSEAGKGTTIELFFPDFTEDGNGGDK